MPVLTRNMRKDAGLPDLPARFPSDVPKIATQPRARGPRAIPRSTLRALSPAAFPPPYFDAPSPLTSLTLTTHSTSSRHSRRPSHTSSYSSSAYLDDDDDDGTETETEAMTLYRLHPGVEKLQRMRSPAKWSLYEERDSMRMYPTPMPFPVSDASSAPRSPMSSRYPTTTPSTPTPSSPRYRASPSPPRQHSGRPEREESLESEWSLLSKGGQPQAGGSGSRSRASSSEATRRSPGSVGRGQEERTGRRVSSRR
ncbi:hypothetical protein C8R46DRAFT_1043373 [Mycena filopes]|nr:hypothetical protein C8R46DRAFT_1043373 [Mycena filopes]